MLPIKSCSSIFFLGTVSSYFLYKANSWWFVFQKTLQAFLDEDVVDGISSCKKKNVTNNVVESFGSFTMWETDTSGLDECLSG